MSTKRTYLSFLRRQPFWWFSGSVVLLIALVVVWRPWRGIRIEQIGSSRPGQGTIHALCLMPDEDVLLTASGGETIEFRSLPDGQLLRTLSGHSNSVSALTLAANGRTLYSGDLAGDLKVWDLKTGKVTRELATGRPVIRALAVNPKETALAVECRDGTVHLWDFQQAGALSPLSSPGWHSLHLSMSSDGKFLAFSAMLNRKNQAIHVWDLNSLTITKTFSADEDSHTLVQFLDGTHTFVTDGELGTLELWDVASGRWKGTLKAPITVGWSALAHTAEGNLLAAGADQGWLVVWDLATKERIYLGRAHTATIFAMAFSKDGKRLVTGCHDIGFDDRPGHAEIKVWAIRR
ncbi:MAG: WD40 repeat domain-containing protein [Planctomycetes bacterium]|nr:WD40 repeat domain-containing protein [Planctomycetota bacterium]